MGINITPCVYTWMRRLIAFTKSILFILFLSMPCYTFATTEHSQNTRIDLNLTNKTLEYVFNKIEKESGYTIIIKNDEVNLKEKVSLYADKETLEEVLNEVLKRQGLKYDIKDNHIIIYYPENAKPSAPQPEKKEIAGTIVDEEGAPIIGASIIEIGASNGVISDIDGKFELTVQDEATLRITYIGYIAQEVNVRRTSFLNITLKEDIKSLDEVVVIGFGTQKKVNLTGSVSSVSAKDLAERPQPNVQNVIQGRILGLDIVSNTAQPGRDSGNITLRGKGSFDTNSSPLVLVDGLVGDLNSLSADDIESVSVLKDAASAAIYGARAANGVILVTTKKGSVGKAQVSYSFNYGSQKATKLSNQIWDSATYMEMFNQVADRIGGRIKYSEELINKYKDTNKDRNLYPDYNWMDETFKTGSNMTHNLNVSGGSEKMTYNVSFGYLDQDGLLPNHTFKRYTGLISLEAQVHKNIKIGASTNFFYSKIREPYYRNDALILMIAQSRPMTKPYLPDGSGKYSYTNVPEEYGGEWLNRNPIWAMNETSRNIENWINSTNAYAIVDFLHNDNVKLKWTTKGGFRYTDQFQNSHYPAHPKGYYYLKESDYKAGGADEHLFATDFFPEKGVNNSDARTFYRMVYTTLEYDWNITEDHNTHILLGYQEEAQSARNLSGSRKNYPSDSMTEIDGGSTVDQSLSGNLSEYALRSFFGRATYSFKSKYLFETNFRYDGTSRIHADNRWGVFPSFSGAWRISEESFITENHRWINNLKLRASWGKLGNSEIGNYPYQEVYNTTAYIFDGQVQQGIYQADLKDKSLKWETTTVTDIGLDVQLANGLFYGTFGWYNKTTDGILSKAAIPASVGMGAPTINYGRLRNRGVEFEVGHANNIGDFTYGASFMASFNKNKVLELRAPSYGSYIYEVGKPYGEHFLYIWDGIFQSDEDVSNSPKHPNNPKPGDIKFKDLNNDNVINQKDRTTVGGKYPKMLYSFNLNVGYKNIDLSAFFQGVSGRKIWTNFFGEDPFAQGASPSKKFLNAWTPENTDTNVPALYAWGYAPMTGTRSTYNLKDASYLRLKNLQLGYNFPKTLTSKLGVQFLRVYFSGENLFTITDYPDFDPERGGDGWHVQYPQAKTFSFGLNLRF